MRRVTGEASDQMKVLPITPGATLGGSPAMAYTLSRMRGGGIG
jgi:hypothetical protein